MAAQLQTLTDQKQVEELLKLKKGTDLTPQQLVWITTILLPALQQTFGEEKVKDINQAITLVKQNPEIILSIFSKQKDAGTQVEGALLNHLVRQMKQDKAKLSETLNTVYADLPKKERDNIKFIIATLQNQRLQETIATNQKIQEDLMQAKQNLNPKGSNNLANTEKLAQTLVEAIDKGEKLNLSKEKLEEIEQKLVQAIITNPKQEYQETPTPINQDELVILALATIAINTDQEILANNPIVETARALNKGFRPVTPEDYQQILAADIKTPAHVYSPEINQVFIPPSPEDLATEREVGTTIQEIVQNSAPFLLTEPGKDTLENANQEAVALADKAQDSPQILNASEEIISPITEGQKQTIVRFVNTINPQALTHSQPNPDASKAAAILEETGNPEDKNLAVATQMASMGLTSQQIYHMVAIAENGKDNAVTRLVNSNPDVIKAMAILGIELKRIEATTPPVPDPGQKPTPAFHQEISQGKTNTFRSFFQPIYNKFSSRLPIAISRPLNVIFHPIDSLKSWLGRRAGKAIVQRLGKTVIGKAAGAFLKNGIKQGTKWLIKQGVKRGLQAAVQLINAIPIAGQILAVALPVLIEIADFAYNKILKPIFKFALAPIMGIITDIFGKPNLKEDIPAAILGVGAGAAAAFTAIPAVLSAAGSAAFAATTAAGTTIIIASGITIVFYLAAFNMGPIISSMAQMGMPITGGTPGLNTTGPITKGREAIIDKNIDLTQPGNSNLPFGNPSSNFSSIAQKAHEGTHTIAWGFNLEGETFQSEGEAVDYMMTPGTPIQATHDGTAYYFSEGTSGRLGLGNHVIIVSEHNGQKFTTIYGHLQGLAYPSGSSIAVNRGDIVGSSGQSGTLGDSPHLHYEIIGLGDITRYLP